MSAPPKKRQSRKERRLKRENGVGVAEKLNFTLREIQPLTENQKLTFETYKKIIVVEDDLITTTNFLSYMNNSLYKYEQKK